MYNNVD